MDREDQEPTYLDFLDSIVKTVIRENGWAFDKIPRMYYDELDYNGLIFWYNDVVDIINAQNAAQAQAKNRNR